MSALTNGASSWYSYFRGGRVTADRREMVDARRSMFEGLNKVSER